MTNIKNSNEQKIEISGQIQSFASSLNNYTKEYESILTDISKKLPAIEKQIDNNVLEARELLNFIFSSNTSETSYGVKHELNQFHKQLESALKILTESEKIDKGFYYGKESLKLDTNIGEVVIDSYFGFIYSIEQGDKSYKFSDASINTVKDSDVNIPEHLL